MKTYYLTILLFILLPGYSFSQEDICIGKKYKIHSEFLQEEREYLVYLPASYHQEEGSQKKYPVIYLTDGESFFHSLTAIHTTFSRGRMALMPECIIVGIINTDRTRDLTPTKSAYRRDGTKQEGDMEEGGGSDLFLNFMTNELREAVDANYRTNETNMLFGHSYGGLFVLNTLLHHTGLFDVYIALDPSLWWDNAKLAKDAVDLLQSGQFQHKTLYVGVAGMMRKDRQYIHMDVMKQFLEEALPEAQGLIYHSTIFPDENHGSIPLPGMIDAFRKIYAKKK